MMKIHIFIDAENVPVANALEVCDVFSEELGACEIDVVGKEETLPQSYLKRRSESFRIHNCDYGKNSADMYLTVIIAKAIYEEYDTDILTIVTNDRDFAPIIQLAVEKHKQVLLLGLEAQSKGWEQALERMSVDLDYVTLGLIDSAPISESIKIEDLPVGLYEYYKKHYKGCTIFAKRGDHLIELPFIDGMNAAMFLDLMRRCHVWTKSQKLEDEIDSLYLRVVNKRVRFMGKYDSLSEFNNPMLAQLPDSLKDYYRENYEGETIFVKREDKLLEMPFIRGMHVSRFIQLMRHFKIWSRSQKWTMTLKKLEELGLKVENDHVVYDD